MTGVNSARESDTGPEVAPPRVERIAPCGILWQMLDDHRGESWPPLAEHALGPLAGLLIAKWAGYGASCEKGVRPSFCLGRRVSEGQWTGRSVRRMAVTATGAGEPETRGFMEPVCL